MNNLSGFGEGKPSIMQLKGPRITSCTTFSHNSSNCPLISRNKASNPKAVTPQGGCEGVEQSGMLSAWRHTLDTNGEGGGSPQYAVRMVPYEVVHCSSLGRHLAQPGRGREWFYRGDDGSAGWARLGDREEGNTYCCLSGQYVPRK